MVATHSIVEIEIDDPTNANLYFRPLKRKLRGRFDLHRVKDSTAMKSAAKWPDPIPGQRLSLDFEARTAVIRDPLHDPDQAANRRRIEQEGVALPPAAQVIANVDVATYRHWMQRAVESGVARVVAGEFRTVDGKPQTVFFSTPRADPTADLAVAINRMADAQEQQTKVLAALVERLVK